MKLNESLITHMFPKLYSYIDYIFVFNFQLNQLHPLTGKRFAEEMECHWGCSFDILRSEEFLVLICFLKKDFPFYFNCQAV